MHRARRIIATTALALICLLLTCVWVRSYWRVDKAWAQVLPNHTLQLNIQPGKMTLGIPRSAVTLPVGEGDWFTWPVEVYFAEYIVWPANPIVGEFHLENSYVTFPLWLPVTLTSMFIMALFSLQFLQRPSAVAATIPTLLSEPAPRRRTLRHVFSRFTRRLRSHDAAVLR